MLDLIKGRGRAVFASSDAVIYLFNFYKFIGLNPPSKYRIPYFIYSAIMTSLSALFLFVLFSASLYNDLDVLSIMEILQYLGGLLNALAIPVKSLAFFSNVKSLRSIEQILTKLDKYYTAPADQIKIKRCVIFCNLLAFVFGVSYAMYLSTTSFGALLTGRAPYALWIPNLDWRNSKSEYYVQFVFDFVVVFYALGHQVVYDSYPGIYIYITRTQIQLLARRVERLGYDEQKSQVQNVNELRECIAVHQDILRLVNIYKPVVSITIFAQFFVAAAILSVNLVNFVIFANLQTRIALCFYYLAVALQTLPTCYQASQLEIDCEKLSLAIFHCNWGMQSKRFHNLLVYFLHRSQDLIPLTAMKLVLINLATNLAIAKFSFSLYTFIQKMGLDEKLKN
ncbi:odorant receptor 7a-like [Eurosta solidaginis]|uniref:odorant receptor 7a-like n=1 Tax=Eurosta solidaginis TaxID=178769 RepID=UPI003530F3CB